ncbi:hypothetical protein SAMN05192534_12417 [Alteribacillus persepolensis]|uniref:Uncharacterized protein n=1 Tax=Alteribacillus persepolensis TaxID=568899 RepID=A0A1G8IH41_9BACI|nr:hypothetical protein SAMN05192534_12417 [Alteribacillus persepolensis]
MFKNITRLEWSILITFIAVFLIALRVAEINL